MITIVYPIYPMKTFFTSPTKTIVKLEFAMRQLRTPTRKRGHHYDGIKGRKMDP